MRSFIKFILLLFLSIFFIAGCYTQFTGPQVDTDDEYVTDDQDIQSGYEYDEEEPYYEEPDSEVVNYNVYNIDNYYPPYGGQYDVWFVDPFYYPPYDWYFYTGLYPHYWWDPFYHHYYPSWYVGFWWANDYYWYQDYYYWDRYGGGGGYRISDPLIKRDFKRRSLGQLNRRVKEQINRPASVAKRQPTRIERSKVIVDRNEIQRRQLSPQREKREAAKNLKRITKPKSDGRVERDIRKKQVIRKKPTIKKPVKNKDATGKEKSRSSTPKIKPRQKVRKVPQKAVKPRSSSGRKTTPRVKKSNTPKQKSSSSSGRTRVKSTSSTRHYNPPRIRSSRSYHRPEMKRTVSPRSVNRSQSIRPSHRSSLGSRSESSRGYTGSTFRSSGSSTSAGSMRSSSSIRATSSGSRSTSSASSTSKIRKK